MYSCAVREINKAYRTAVYFEHLSHNYHRSTDYVTVVVWEAPGATEKRAIMHSLEHLPVYMRRTVCGGAYTRVWESDQNNRGKCTLKCVLLRLVCTCICYSQTLRMSRVVGYWCKLIDSKMQADPAADLLPDLLPGPAFIRYQVHNFGSHFWTGNAYPN